MIDHLKHVADGVSIGIIATTLVGWLPPLAAAISIAWTIYQWRLKVREMKKNGSY